MSISRVFFITAGTFGAMSIYGYTTKKDLTKSLTLGMTVNEHARYSHDSLKIEDRDENKKTIIKKFDIKSSLLNLNKNEFKNITRDSNFASILKSYNHAKASAEDLIYFVEDDYIHEEIAIQEMLLTYERISSQINKEIIIFPVDYPFLYAQNTPTYILLGNNKHWRKTDQSLATLLVSKEMLINYWNNFYEFATVVTDPAEKPLHKIYEKEACFSPIPSLALHCTNINSIYGLSPNINWKKLWEENKL